jgi:mono/diheme cytochrome c family protein
MSLKIIRDASRKMLNGGDYMAGGNVEERRFSAAASSALDDGGFSRGGRILHRSSLYSQPLSHNVRMRLARTLAPIALLALTSATPFSAQAQKPARAAATADLPVGPMQAKATTACTECHDARIILQQRISKAAWTKEVDKMTNWGALVSPADRDALIDYLSTNFSPDKPAYEAQRTAADKSGKTPK